MKQNKKLKTFFIFLIFVGAQIFAQNTENLVDVASKNGTVVYWDTLTQAGILEKNGKQISFRNGDNFVLLGFNHLEFTDAPTIENGVLKVSKKFISTADSFFNTQEEGNISYKIGVILIDPGHGGKDPGANMTHKINGKNVHLKEKDINLTVAKMLAERLKTAYPDKKIIMTRSTDKFVSLQDRTEIANSVQHKDNEAVLYVSIHVNASLDKNARGFETWYLSPGYRRTVIDKNGNATEDDSGLFDILNSMMEEEYTTESILIAKFIMDGLQAQVGSLSVSRGIKAQEWFVVRNSKMPSVLVEVGFVTNYQEACLLNETSYLQKTAFGIYNGLAAFVTHFERSRGFTGK